MLSNQLTGVIGSTYDLADSDKARERIEDADWNTLLKNDDINISWTNWKNKFYEIIYECIPRATSTIGSNVLWLNRKLVNGTRRQNVFFKRAKQLKTSASSTKFNITNLYQTFTEPKRLTKKSCVIRPQMPRNSGVL